MKENVSRIYECYYTFKGNGMVTSMIEEIYKLPIDKNVDTLWNISPKYYNDGSKYYKIAKTNNLKGLYIIHPGQKLRIPLE